VLRLLLVCQRGCVLQKLLLLQRPSLLLLLLFLALQTRHLLLGRCLRDVVGIEEAHICLQLAGVCA